MAQFKHSPIDRHEALAPFSRDHYTGLVQAQHLINAAEADDVARRKVLAEFVDAWDREIAEHFRDEERLFADFLSDDQGRRLLEEHQRLGDLAERARELRREVDPDAATLHQIGRLLEQHIRWEERELFCQLQEQLDDDQLNQLQQQTAEIEQSRPRNASRTKSPSDGE